MAGGTWGNEVTKFIQRSQTVWSQKPELSRSTGGLTQRIAVPTLAVLLSLPSSACSSAPDEPDNISTKPTSTSSAAPPSAIAPASSAATTSSAEPTATPVSSAPPIASAEPTAQPVSSAPPAASGEPAIPTSGGAGGIPPVSTALPPPSPGCASGDGTCPPGCSASNDSDCPPDCGNGLTEVGEFCDPPSNCPTSCDDANLCTLDQLVGSATSCNAVCRHTVIAECLSGDGCCPTGCNANNDSDCSPLCGNAVAEVGETCDPIASCPASCDDANACTADLVTGSAATCSAACKHIAIVDCAAGDNCCPSGCNAASDSDCSPLCGNGVAEAGETCDPVSSCPASCNDNNACTTDLTTGGIANCNLACSHTSITVCAAGDGCCPSSCNAKSDGDCAPQCGNGIVEPGELCDPTSSCTSGCNDSNACTVDQMIGSAAECNATCSHTTITTCTSSDGCCPASCNATNDDDCAPICGNAALDLGETCDPPSSCATGCSDDDVCTTDQMTGSAATCNVACTHSAISSCASGDGCCPSGCTFANDSDCLPVCGNGQVEGSETCDPVASCPTACADANACTVDQLTGSAANCNAACSHTPILACASGDGCCPSGCNATNDTDCAPKCGNGVVESGETCDPTSACPTACSDDNNACTKEELSGTAATCNVECHHTAITTCKAGDGCCPSGCTKNTDGDCSASCGNGTIETGETCDPPSSCPTSCSDGNACTADIVSGSAANCNVSCVFPAITSCQVASDGCCPDACNDSNDSDCTARPLTFIATELLGRPTTNSVTLNALTEEAAEAYVEYGTFPGNYDKATSPTQYANGVIETVIGGLAADTQYYYRMRYRRNGAVAQYLTGAEHSFHTMRASGKTFTFAVQSDSHQGYPSFYNDNLYHITMNNILGGQPDFLIDLGDTVSTDDSTEDRTSVAQKYLNQRKVFDTVAHSTPVFLALGNHENEEGWNLDDFGTNRQNSLPVLGANARKYYFLNPVPDAFYSGNWDPLPELDGDHLREDYYAFEWGNALLVAIDPYWYTMTKPFAGGWGGEKTDDVGSGDRWDWTLGRTQYDWLKRTLESSTARFKFVFAHQMTGGTDDYVRAGARGAKYCEWGGYNEDGTTYAFNARRPGWAMPIHNLFRQTGVTAFFHGHDHVYAKETLDGIIYQEVPHAGKKPYDGGFSTNPEDYQGAVLVNNSGHLRVTVSATQVRVEYIRSYLPGDGTNGEIAHSYQIP